MSSTFAATDLGLDLRGIPPVEAGALLARANALVRASRQGPLAPALRGKNIGLLSAAEDDPNTAFLAKAAAELGAHVAHVRSSLTDASSPAEIAEMGRVLGRLYDAVDLHGSRADVARRLSQAAGVPVFDGIASAQHPIARWAARLDGAACAEDARRFLLQALLLTTLS